MGAGTVRFLAGQTWWWHHHFRSFQNHAPGPSAGGRNILNTLRMVVAPPFSKFPKFRLLAVVCLAWFFQVVGSSHPVRLGLSDYIWGFEARISGPGVRLARAGLKTICSLTRLCLDGFLFSFLVGRAMLIAPGGSPRRLPQRVLPAKQS